MSTATTRLSWGHINVRDLDRSIVFYETLGFTIAMPGNPYLGLGGLGPGGLGSVPGESVASGGTVVPAQCCEALGWPDGTRARACIMRLGEGFPMLDLTEIVGGVAAAPASNVDLGAVRICLATNALEADYDTLRTAGVRFRSSPTEGHDGLADFVLCADPDGTLIELIQIRPERWVAASPEQATRR